MDKLQKARLEINEIDKQMAELFCRRMDAVRVVSEHKRELGLPVHDPVREAEVIERNSALIKDDELRSYYVKYLRDNMRLSCDFQRKLAEGERVAFCGVEGAFAHVAARKLFPTSRHVPYPDFDSAYSAVQNGECDVAVLPIENSTAGEVSQVIDMMFSGSLYVTGVYDLSVSHNLMSVKGASIGDVKTVISHPQALMQCSKYIQAKGFEKREFENTAMAAKYVAEANDKSLAAIASRETAELYGLQMLESNINETAINTTRFGVLSRAHSDDGISRDKHSIIMFTVRNEAGSLAKAMSIIGECGYNMRCLRSRPMKELLWQYYFYVELEGSIANENGKRMMKELRECCDQLKLVGTFKFPSELA